MMTHVLVSKGGAEFREAGDVNNYPSKRPHATPTGKGDLCQRTLFKPAKSCMTQRRSITFEKDEFWDKVLYHPG